MYRLNFILIVNSEDRDNIMKEYNEQKDAMCTHTAGLGDNQDELDIIINFEADTPYNAIQQGAKIAENYRNV